MECSYGFGVYRFHLRNYKKIDMRADKVVTLGGVIYIFLNDKIIRKLLKRDVLYWNLK